ncbi:hypothetical protein GCM10009022_23770 [Vreelandella titanicae]
MQPFTVVQQLAGNVIAGCARIQKQRLAFLQLRYRQGRHTPLLYLLRILFGGVAKPNLGFFDPGPAPKTLQHISVTQFTNIAPHGLSGAVESLGKKFDRGMPMQFNQGNEFAMAWVQMR